MPLLFRLLFSFTLFDEIHYLNSEPIKLNFSLHFFEPKNQQHKKNKTENLLKLVKDGMLFPAHYLKEQYSIFLFYTHSTNILYLLHVLLCFFFQYIKTISMK